MIIIGFMTQPILRVLKQNVVHFKDSGCHTQEWNYVFVRDMLHDSHWLHRSPDQINIQHVMLNAKVKHMPM